MVSGGSRESKRQKLCENVELALELDTPQLYEAWLQEPMETFAKNTGKNGACRDIRLRRSRWDVFI